MKFWQLLVLFSVLFVIFLHFSSSLMIKTMNHIAMTESFKDKNNKNNKDKNNSKKKIKKKSCESYFVSIPQDIQIMKECADRRDAKCKTISKKEFCAKLKKSGWNPNWSKKSLSKKKNDPEILKVRKNIKNNMGVVTETEIMKCFPKYKN